MCPDHCGLDSHVRKVSAETLASAAFRSGTHAPLFEVRRLPLSNIPATKSSVRLTGRSRWQASSGLVRSALSVIDDAGGVLVPPRALVGWGLPPAASRPNQAGDETGRNKRSEVCVVFFVF